MVGYVLYVLDNSCLSVVWMDLTGSRREGDLRSAGKSKTFNFRISECNMRPHLPRSKVALGQYCVNCCAITSLPSSLGSHLLARCPSESFTKSRQSKRAFQSSAIRLYTNNSPLKLPPKLKSKSPVVCDQQLSQWEAKYFQLIPSSNMQRRSSCLETFERMGSRYREFDKSLSKTSQLLEFTETSLKGRN